MFVSSPRQFSWTLAVQLCIVWCVSGQALLAQASGSGEIVGSDSASGDGVLGLAITFAGVAGDNSRSTYHLQSSTIAHTFKPVTATAPPIFEGNAISGSFSASASGSSIGLPSKPSSNPSGATPHQNPICSTVMAGIGSSPPIAATGCSINPFYLSSGASGASGLASTGLDSSYNARNGSWTFSKSGLTIAPTLTPTRTVGNLQTHEHTVTPITTDTLAGSAGADQKPYSGDIKPQMNTGATYTIYSSNRPSISSQMASNVSAGASAMSTFSSNTPVKSTSTGSKVKGFPLQSLAMILFCYIWLDLHAH